MDASACGEPERADRRNMMSETVVTMDSSSNNASNNPRQVPTVKTEPGQPNPLAGIRLNVSYFKTIPGIIKLVQLVSGPLLAILFVPFVTREWESRSCARARRRTGTRLLIILILRPDSKFECCHWTIKSPSRCERTLLASGAESFFHRIG